MPKSKTKGEGTCADKVENVTASVAVTEGDTESITKSRDATAIVTQSMSANVVATEVAVASTRVVGSVNAIATSAVKVRRFISSDGLRRGQKELRSWKRT